MPVVKRQKAITYGNSGKRIGVKYRESHSYCLQLAFISLCCWLYDDFLLISLPQQQPDTHWVHKRHPDSQQYGPPAGLADTFNSPGRINGTLSSLRWTTPKSQNEGLVYSSLSDQVNGCLSFVFFPNPIQIWLRTRSYIGHSDLFHDIYCAQPTLLLNFHDNRGSNVRAYGLL